MARILYGVMGDARGHVSRAQAIAQELRRHNFLFVGGGRVHDLRSEGYEVVDVPMASTFYRNNRVDFPATVRNAAKVLLRETRVTERLAEIIRDYDPELTLTDYELFTPLAARKLGLPCVSLDHQHVLTHCVHTPLMGHHLVRLITCFIVRRLYSAATIYLITSFFQLSAKRRGRAEVFPPILRPSVQDHRPTEGDHVLVYFKDMTFKAHLPHFEKRGRRFLIYGFGERPLRGNLVFKGPSKDGFLEDLASCRYVISNAGHSLISEALYFGKPVLCFPVRFAYEQLINAHYLSQLGFGDYSAKTADVGLLLDRFEARVPQYRTHIGKYAFFGNHLIARRLETLLREGHPVFSEVSGNSP